MPTITHEPIGIAAEGTTGDLAFSDDHLIELAELSGYETTNIILPLQQAAAAIGRFRYTLDASTMPAVQRAAIAQTRGLAVGLLTNLRGRNDAGHPQGLDEQSKALLQLAYAGACGKTPEQARSTFEEFDDSEVVARYDDAKTALDTLRGTLEKLVANVRVVEAWIAPDVKRGRPPSRLKNFARAKLGRAWDDVVEPRSQLRTSKRERLIGRSLKMLLPE